jgi:hypothetical protein
MNDTLKEQLNKIETYGNESELTSKQLVLRGLKATVEKLSKMPVGEARMAAEKRLIYGSIKRSKVEGVTTMPALEHLFRSLNAEALQTDQQPVTGNVRMRFYVPASFKAFTPLVRVKDLCDKGKLFKAGIHVAELYKDGKDGMVVEYRDHAPDIRPVRTDFITIFLDPKQEYLVEWYAGIDATLFPPSADRGSHWVYLGGDLEVEHMRERRKNAK